ncbi:pleckstrin homology domain-containing family A member 5 isoform X2 [Boleophthalmus pectinirostris]|uniref:pleckstrin homology domain-containing family A member 5 isoform X2 n=1 Tax=Boleophthalmus pectinirostris TaxID=150288 RepID=UPI002431AD8D|nr:pleckstrin homology domain-containing family A member 5 isoform X2 [Boleophthalmus pectinirostris]
MAAELQPEWISCLPSTWSYGVTRDGRVFFVNEEAKSTTWLHPVSGEALITGHRKTPDLPTGWEEGYTFEGARCFINHNERKVTCKHPVSGVPSQDNCIFVVSEQTAAKAPANERKPRPVSTMSEASNYTGSDHANSPAGKVAEGQKERPSRPSKKIHNFGKRSNSIRRNPGAPVIKKNWLYKQDSTGMKLWKKRWFVLSDLCLFYYRDEKEEGILGSILLPSFHISMLSVDDHINRKYAFKATHPNMRTYYFCTDTAKEMESWMKVMTDAALVHSEPVIRLDRLKVEQCGPQEINHVANHRPALTQPEIQNNERNIEVAREHAAPVSPISAEEERKHRDAERYGFQKDGEERERPLTKINSIKLQPNQAAAVTANVVSKRTPAETDGQHNGPQVNGGGETCLDETPAVSTQRSPAHPEPDRTLSRTNSMQQLEQWVRTQRGRGQDDDTRSVTSYQTMPRNMPSHRVPYMPQYGDGYRSMPRNSMAQRDSICSMSPSLYDQALGPSPADKRRSMRDDTLWQLYEWQQRQAYNRHSGLYSNMASPKTMINLSDHAPPSHSIPPSPSHGSLSMYGGYSPMRSYNMSTARSELSSPVYRRDMGMDRRLRPPVSKYAYPPDRRSMPAGIPVQTISAQSLQGKTLSPDDYREQVYTPAPQELDIDARLSRLCEQDKVVKTQESKLQQLYREKHTLETALLSASQEIEMGSDNPTALQSVIQQRDLLQSGLLSTCRELSRVSTELERSWKEYDRLEAEVVQAKSSLLEQLEALGSPQMEPPSQEHVHIQKELWRIQDVIEALNKQKAQRSVADGTGVHGAKNNFGKHKNEEEEEDSVPPRPPLPQSYEPNPSTPVPSTRSLHRPEDRKAPHRNGTHAGTDYRLYKSEPELTTVTEVDESNGEDRSEHPSERDHSGNKGMSYPVGIVPPRTKSPVPDSSSIASYVTLRKGKRPDSRTERPRSAVEQQLNTGDSGRPRMSVEEQLERIRRHQQAALQGKKKSQSMRCTGGSQESTPTRSQSFTKENHVRNAQWRRRDDVVSCDIQELEASLRQQEEDREQETPAEEIARLKEASLTQHFNVDRELSVPDKVLIPERYVELEPEEALSPEQEADKQRKVDRIKALIAKNSMQNVLPSLALSPEDVTEEEVTIQEKEKMINISYEIAAEASKRSKLVAVRSLSSSSPPQSPNSPPQLIDGSHFMCV